MGKPIINLQSGFNEHLILAHIGQKVRIAFRDSKNRKRIKLCKVNIRFNCECCGCMVEAVDKSGNVIAISIGGFMRS